MSIIYVCYGTIRMGWGHCSDFNLAYWSFSFFAYSKMGLEAGDNIHACGLHDHCTFAIKLAANMGLQSRDASEPAYLTTRPFFIRASEGTPERILRTRSRFEAGNVSRVLSCFMRGCGQHPAASNIACVLASASELSRFKDSEGVQKSDWRKGPVYGNAPRANFCVVLESIHHGD